MRKVRRTLLAESTASRFHRRSDGWSPGSPERRRHTSDLDSIGGSFIGEAQLEPWDRRRVPAPVLRVAGIQPALPPTPTPDAEVAGVHHHRYRADVIATVAKKVVVNEQGTPVEVILSWKTFQEIAEAMGWDLDATAKSDLRQSRRDLAKGNRKAFVPLSAL